ncbi:patatin-like phospholipase family protein [Variovorax sp. J22G73]|uniref:patatin-like phospholipase family protein n=1 Tax=unclassified Variovorax TaxID=663243 RepID=UPI000D5CC736|nr:MULTISPECIES: patatin-like phospholipase family protein [unclassified Variovorax]MDM0009638.1 patatin-like phospholipase family protein [Variovorax sp. J22R203]MDM0102146.1 patatin-like phospholipase family protein [Variovorax sp. J22G73]
MATKRKFTILAFVGGGIRGLMSSTILNRLWENHPWMLDTTDLIAGCSTGSIITSEILAGKTPPELIKLFTHGEIKFYDHMSADPRKPAYDIDKAYASQYLLHGDAPVNGLKDRKALFVSFNVGGLDVVDGIVVPRPWEPRMYTNMLDEADRLQGLDGHGGYAIAKAATSSGAMPGQLGSFDGNVDGTYFNHDPTVAAIALAVHKGHALEDITAITIGTGLMPDWVAEDTHDWGADQWMNGVANPFDNTPPFLMNQARPSPMLDMCLNGTSAQVMPTMARLLLGKRYANINPRLPCFIPENSTSPQALALLQDSGNRENIDHALELVELHWRRSVMPIET